MMKYLEYAVVFGVVLVLAFSFLMYRPGPAADSSGALVPNGPNFQYYQQKAQALGDECGDLTDVGNVQHLSHHPDRYAACLKKVDPVVLQKATGKTLQQILG